MDWSTTIHHSAIRTQRRTLRQGLHLTTHVDVGDKVYRPTPLAPGWALFLDDVQVSWYASWDEKSMGGILFGCFGKKIPGGDFHHLWKGDVFFQTPGKHETRSISQTAFARVFWTIKKTWFHNQPQNFCLNLPYPHIGKGIHELFSPQALMELEGLIVAWYFVGVESRTRILIMY